MKLLYTLFLFNSVIGDDFHRTPPMGWSSWNTFFSSTDEQKIIGIADAIKSLKLDTFGYKYVTIDDFWNLPQRDSQGKMKTNETRFPNGMKYLGDYLHKLDLKFGIYSDAGHKTCGQMAGSLGYEEIDLDQFLDWDIDYLKYDNCWPVENQINNMDVSKSLMHLPSYYQSPSEFERYRKL